LGAHLALHSFPTRRSSDLVASTSSESQVPFQVQLTYHKPGENHTRVSRVWTCLMPVTRDQDKAKSHLNIQVCSATLAHECSLLADRKSTRLNSSHVKISYA